MNREANPSLAGQEPVDFSVVPGDDHHQPIAVGFHPRQQGVHGFPAERVAAGEAGLDQRVSLVDE